MSFDVSEVMDLFRKQGTSSSALAPLIIPFGSVRFDDYQIDNGELLSKPIVRVGDELIVALPGMLLPAAWNELIRLAIEMGIVSVLAERYKLAVWDSIEVSLGFLEHRPVQFPLPRHNIPAFFDGIFTLDTDKLIYAALVTDPLDGYDANGAFGSWPLAGLDTKIAQRIREIERSILGAKDAPNDILFLIIHQGIGRSMTMPITEPEFSPLLMLSASDLETISILEAGDQMLLWKWALASTKLRKKTEVVCFSALDEFSLYQSGGYSYYLSDDGKPDLLNIAPDGALRLRSKVTEERDFHGARMFNGAMSEVMALHDGAVPVYIRSDSVSHGQGNYAAVLLEGLPLPIWISSGTYERESDRALHNYYCQFSDAIAYWLWQFSPSIRDAIVPLASRHGQILVKLWIEPSELWRRINEVAPVGPDAVGVHADSDTGVLNVSLRSNLVGALTGPDNRGERLLMTRILSGLRDMLEDDDQHLLDDSRIAEVLDRHAPLGEKKKIVLFDAARNLLLDPRGLPKHRKVKLADENVFLDELGEHIFPAPVEEKRPIPDDERTFTLEKAVSFYYGELQKLIASLSPDSLLQILVSQHESLVRYDAFHTLMIPTRLACFSSELELSEKLQKEIPENSRAGLASRFAIEYVVAQPPSGLRPMSLSVYDQIQALAMTIVDFGTESDLIRYQLADIKLSALPSGRIGTVQDEHSHAMETYLPAFASGEIYRARKRFDRHWSSHDATSGAPPEMKQLDSASLAELGVSLSNIRDFVKATLSVGGTGRAFAKLDSETFVNAVAEKTGWPAAKVRMVLDLFSLSPRPDFLKPPKPFRKEDVYPWRYNRPYSYLRRPILRTNTDGDDVIIWGSRHLFIAWQHLVNLMLSGRFQARSTEMRKVMGEFNSERGELFNDAVADLFQQLPGAKVRKRIKKFTGINGQLRPPGDIDILVAEQDRRRLLVVECKDLAVGRAPHELQSELAKLFERENGKPSSVERHLQRVEMGSAEYWLRASLTWFDSRWQALEGRFHGSSRPRAYDTLSDEFESASSFLC